MDVSVVLATYRRPQLLARSLEALLEQDFPRQRFEILVCDDGPDEETLSVVQRFRIRKEAPRLRYVPIRETQGPAGARNRGWRLARGDVVAFTDDDTIADRRWLSAGLAAMREQRAMAVGGRIVVPLPPSPTDYELDAARLERAEFATANCFVLRSALEATGGFDERYTAAWREDSDLQFSLLRSGSKVGRAPEAIVVHPVRPARWGVSVSQAKKSQFEALLYKKHRLHYRERIAGPPWSYYAIAASGIACVAALASGARIAAAVSGALWLALTLRFAAKRLRNTSRAPSHVVEMACTSILIPPLAILWRLYGAVKFRVAFL
jgi:glycosyltransferase involved in cell wall biosynthesis